MWFESAYLLCIIGDFDKAVQVLLNHCCNWVHDIFQLKEEFGLDSEEIFNRLIEINTQKGPESKDLLKYAD